MRIAIFTETFLPKWDGIANTLCYLLEHLEKRGHAAIMFAPQGAPQVYAGTPIVGLPSVEFPLYRDLKLVPPLVNVAEILSAFRPDVIHLVNLASLGLVGLHHAHTMKLPSVASYHTDMATYARHYRLRFLEGPIWAYFRWLHNQADLNLCPSNFTKIQLEAHAFKRVAVWGRGVDTERYHPSHRRTSWRVRLTRGKPELPLLLYVGRLAAEKRIHWLGPLMKALPGPELAIVGDGPMREELTTAFQDTATVFTGYLQGADLAAAYAAADLFVFPSDSETFGNVVLEAMASGLPVVVAGAGGPVDHITHGRNGFLSDPKNPADFVRLVRHCLTEPEARVKMGQQARAYAESQTWEAVLDGLLQQYAQTIRTRSRRPATLSSGAWWRDRHISGAERLWALSGSQRGLEHLAVLQMVVGRFHPVADSDAIGSVR